jgi:hypothetical protein
VIHGRDAHATFASSERIRKEGSPKKASVTPLARISNISSITNNEGLDNF